MRRLNEQQLRALNNGDYSRNGVSVPDTTASDAPLYKAACWAWALAGELVGVEADTSANSIYDNAFNRDSLQRPIGTNDAYLDLVATIWPGASSTVAILKAAFEDAHAGDKSAQQRCRRALMTTAIIANGLTANDHGTGSDYFVQMNTKAENWYAWDHWALGIRMPDGRTVNYVQTVTEVPVQYRCDRVWDEGYYPTIVGIDGLLPAHVAALDRIGG